MSDEPMTETCEGCSKIIKEGDKYFPYDDGPVLCEACCPTWAEADEQFKRDASLAEDEYMMENRRDFAARLEAHLAAGGSREDKLPMSTLD